MRSNMDEGEKLHDLHIPASETRFIEGEVAAASKTITIDTKQNTKAPLAGRKMAEQTFVVQHYKSEIDDYENKFAYNHDSTSSTAAAFSPKLENQVTGALERNLLTQQHTDDNDDYDTSSTSTAKSAATPLTELMYQEIGRKMIQYLWEKQKINEDVIEEDLIFWFIEQVTDDDDQEPETDEQLHQHQYLAQIIIGRLINVGAVFVAKPSTDPLRPELRVLMKNPYVQLSA